MQEWRAEASRVDLRSHGVAATGTQLGVEPVPYRLDYHLDAPDEFVTKQLQAEVAGEGWRRRIDLRRDPNGAWSCEAGADGEVDLPPPGGSVEGLGEALDCDLGLSPMTNLMPIRRRSLHERSRSVDFLMAWISVPDLGLHPSQQRYEHVSRDEQGAVVRYVGAHRDYVGELELDTDGLVLHYPELARRVGKGPA